MAATPPPLGLCLQLLPLLLLFLLLLQLQEEVEAEEMAGKPARAVAVRIIIKWPTTRAGRPESRKLSLVKSNQIEVSMASIRISVSF